MTTTLTEKPQPAKRSSSRASRAAAKAAADTPQPAAPTTRQKRHIALSALVHAAADMLEGWDDDRLTKAEAAEIVAHRLSYCGDVDWDDRLPAMTVLASRQRKSD